MFNLILLTPFQLAASESVPNDDLYEKSVNMVTTVMQLEGTDDNAHFTTIHESSNHMLKIAILDTKKVLYACMFVFTCIYGCYIYTHTACGSMVYMFLHMYMYIRATVYSHKTTALHTHVYIWFTMCISWVVCQTSYVYSLLMRANWLETAAVQGSLACLAPP